MGGVRGFLPGEFCRLPKCQFIECQKHLLVIDIAGKTMRLVSKLLSLKGEPQYKVPPDCDPEMW